MKGHPFYFGDMKRCNVEILAAILKLIIIYVTKQDDPAISHSVKRAQSHTQLRKDVQQQCLWRSFNPRVHACMSY